MCYAVLCFKCAYCTINARRGYSLHFVNSILSHKTEIPLVASASFSLLDRGQPRGCGAQEFGTEFSLYSRFNTAHQQRFRWNAGNRYLRNASQRQNPLSPNPSLSIRRLVAWWPVATCDVSDRKPLSRQLRPGITTRISVMELNGNTQDAAEATWTTLLNILSI